MPGVRGAPANPFAVCGLREVAVELGISPEYVRQIEKKRC